MKVFGPGMLWFHWRHTPGDQSILRFETDGDDCGWVDTVQRDGDAKAPAAAERAMVRVSEAIGRPVNERRRPTVRGFRNGRRFFWGQSQPQFSESDA